MQFILGDAKLFIFEYASEHDVSSWKTLDRHLPESELIKKINEKRCYFIKDGEKIVGVLRYNLFWDLIPFLNLIFLDESYRGKDFGRKAMLHWEDEMGHLGYEMVMTSTQSDEQAQHFYRKLGYKDSGCLIINSDEPTELFFTKTILHTK